MTALNTQVSPDDPRIARVVANILKKQEARFGKGQFARRDVHEKGFLVPALFEVIAVPAELQVGLFATPKLYSAHVRFSNGLLGPNAFDAAPNVRAMALQIEGVAGKKLRVGDEDSPNMNILTANSPVFQVASLDDYLTVQEKGLLAGLAATPHVIAPLLRQVFQIVGNPICRTHYSQSAYAFGEQRAVKYILVPDESDSLWPLPDFGDPDYLRHKVERELQRREMTMKVCVQFQLPDESIEDTTIEWKGEPVQVARLIFPRQPDLIVPRDSGERLSFDPWRTIEAHRPLGWIGLARRAAYLADSQWRTRHNDQLSDPA